LLLKVSFQFARFYKRSYFGNVISMIGITFINDSQISVIYVRAPELLE